MTQALPALASRWHTWLPWSVAALAAVVAVGTFWSATRAPVAEDPPPVVRLTLPLPDGLQFNRVAPIAPFPALSPDGRYLALVLVRGNEASSLFIHTMKGLETRQVPGTAGALLPFWSPDGRSIGFFSQGKLKRVDMETNAIQVIADAVFDGSASHGGGAWAPDGTVIVSGPEGLYRVPAPVAAPRRRSPGSMPAARKRPTGIPPCCPTAGISCFKSRLSEPSGWARSMPPRRRGSSVPTRKRCTSRRGGWCSSDRTRSMLSDSTPARGRCRVTWFP